MKPVALNAIHTHTGGGLIYLKSILPHLAQSKTIQWHLFLDKKAKKFLDTPKNVIVHYENVPESLIKKHLWEQCILPFKLWKKDIKATLCNANYTPFLAPNPIPIIHNNCAVEQYALTKKQKQYWRILKKMTRLSLKRSPFSFSVAKHIVPTYANTAKEIEKVYIASPAAPLLAQETVSKENKLFLSIGDFYLQKDYDVLIQAFHEVQKIHTDARLYIVGKAIHEEVNRFLKTYIAQNKLERSVTLTGSIPHTQLIPLLKRATLYVNTSLIECFNMPVLEALTCETPVVAYDRPFQKEVAGDAAYYIPFSEDKKVRISRVSKHILNILEQNDLRQLLINAGKKQARHFSWDKSAQIILKQLNLLLNK